MEPDHRRRDLRQDLDFSDLIGLLLVNRHARPLLPSRAFARVEGVGRELKQE
ncbi:MAG: hypothetical protein AVDCRST_MAG69-1305 [uncultured Solirubrobacteraceae bacterium]|uniref:Uncharacterized protein n=1 Tax=uncultured Solirubrobacteraceae bacterium TaxID=1162706 RepID=A0A6J4S6R4_9ACTN|nr:MAG: hypothetical protein AVDCRST_MAG69-1305 [uncultured Solirubrobacteraceae bacterium]